MESPTALPQTLIMPFDQKAKLEVKTYTWVEATPVIFRSWSGPRRINGEEYHGPVYKFLLNI